MSQPALSIRDLPLPVRAAKSDWVVASHWIGFTPTDGSVNAHAQCMSAVAAQMGDGYVLEYITLSFCEPNPGFEHDPGYLANHSAHTAFAGRLVAVHRLLPTARPLRDIVGEADFESMQDVWAKGGKRHRWSVALPIIESFSVALSPPPLAAKIFGAAAMRRLSAHPAALLRPMSHTERAAIAGLPLTPKLVSGVWIGIEADFVKAQVSDIPSNIRHDVEDDLAFSAMEGLTVEQREKVRLRAAWLADKFIRQRQRDGQLRCDDCLFEPSIRTNGTGVSPRSFLDVHHCSPLEEGIRYTTTRDFSLLCPICHRMAHAVMRLKKVQVSM